MLGRFGVGISLPAGGGRTRRGAAVGFPGLAVVLTGVFLTVAKPNIQAATLSNPFPPDPASLEIGQQVFAQNCLACHGAAGRGDGPQAKGLNPPPADLLVHIPLHSEAELFRIINDGIANTAMPSFEEKFSDDERWHLINYLGVFHADQSLAESYYQEGLVYADQGDNEQALDKFNQALKLSPGHAFAYNERGTIYRKQGRYKQAISDHSKAIELQPDYPYAYYGRGIAYADSGDYEQAISDYSKTIELNPSYSFAYYGRGLAYADSGNLEQAVSDYSKTIELKPGYTYAYYSRGLAYTDSGDYQQAIADYSKAIELNPGYTYAYYGRGLAHAGANTPPQAIADFTKAIELAPDFAGAYLDRGLAYYGTAKPDQAAADLNRYLDLAPDAENRAAVETLLAELGQQPAKGPAVEPAAEPAQNTPVAAGGPVLAAADLPAGFEAIPVTGPDQAGNESVPENSFAFFAAEQAQLVWGFTTPLPTVQKQADFDADLKQPGYLMSFLAKGIGDGEILEQKALSLPGIGDVSAGITVVLASEDNPRLDGVVFRRGATGAVIFTMYTDGDAPAASLNNLARTLDTRVGGAN